MGTPRPIPGVPCWGYPTWVPPGVCPMAFWVMLQSIMGYGYPLCLPHDILGNVAKHYGIWVPPPPQCLPHGILGNVAKHYGMWVPPPPGVCPMAFWEMLQSIMGIWVPPSPPWTDRLMDGRTDACQNITFPSYYVRRR